jgi:hypothetical protein
MNKIFKFFISFFNFITSNYFIGYTILGMLCFISFYMYDIVYNDINNSILLNSSISDFDNYMNISGLIVLFMISAIIVKVVSPW